MPQPVNSLPAGTRTLQSALIDRRTDEEIAKSLISPPTEVVSQKNVWAFWNKGFQNLHGWQKRNIFGWVRKFGPDWTVRILDSVPNSPTNLIHYVDTANIPKCVLDSAMSGAYMGQHNWDLIRLPLMYQYGGICLDVGVMILGDLEKSLWDRIVDPTTEYRLGGFSHQHRLSSWGSLQIFCLAAQKGEEILQRWQQLHLELWEDRHSCNGLFHHPMFRDVPSELHPRVLLTIDKDTEATLQDYWCNLLTWEKLKSSEDGTTGWDGPEYVRRHVLLLEPMQEAFAAEVHVRLDTSRLFKMLSCPRDSTLPGVDSALYADAEYLVNHLLTSSTVMKLYHGHGRMSATPLASFWERPGNEDADIREGSFAEYLRHAGEIIDQQREVKPQILPQYQPPAEWHYTYQLATMASRLLVGVARPMLHWYWRRAAATA